MTTTNFRCPHYLHQRATTVHGASFPGALQPGKEFDFPTSRTAKLMYLQMQDNAQATQKRYGTRPKDRAWNEGSVQVQGWIQFNRTWR